MASPQRLSLERSLNQFRRELTDEQRKEISGANRKAINHEIQVMQAKLGREKSLCRLSRIERFLDAMEQIEKLVTIFLNVSEAVAFIWGPIKLVLMAAMAWTNCIRKLLDVYEEIADALDNLAFFQGLIKSDARLSRLLEDYFFDIVLFHHSILDFFSRPDWKAKFQWAWGDLRRKVKPTIESLKRKQGLLSDSKFQPHAILKEIQDSDLYEKDQFKHINSGLEGIIHFEQTKSQKLQEQEIKSFMERKLNVSLSQIGSQVQIPDQVAGSSGSWIFHHPLYQSWEANTLTPGSVSFLSGCPGAGKSTLARTIINHYIKQRPQQSLTCFFFKHNDADRRSVRSMVCYIISQIIFKDDVMMRFAYDKRSPMDYLDLNFLKTLALDCLSSRRDTTMVLDGLDEGNEPDRAIKWCLDELLSTVSSRGCHVRLLICGQEDGRIEPLLSRYPQIRLHKADPHQNDIEEYCKAQASLITSRFRLPPDGESALILKVTKASNGMFLYTKVVLENLASMGSKKKFKAELTTNLFPRNLDEAYGRIVQRVINFAQPSAQASAKKILGLLVCSERPLRWREIQSRFCINADEEVCDPDDLRADTCKHLCSSLVDTTDCETFPGVQSEQTISMIHETASKYLVYTGTIDIMEEHTAMSIFCCRYLRSRPFIATESGSIEDIIQAGYFSFMDYAAVYYESHLEKAEALKDILDSALQIERAKEALLDLRKAYRDDDSDTATGVSPHEETLGVAIQRKVLAIRSIMDSQRDTLSQNTGFQDLEGPRRYKCPRLQCYQFYAGCPSEAALQRRLASHDRPFRCSYEECFAYMVGYASQQALKAHSETFHYEDSQCKTTFSASSKTTALDLIKACKVGNLNNVKSLHRLGSDLLGRSYDNTSPLAVAVEGGHAHICRYLIENGVSPLDTYAVAKTYKKSPLYLAVRKKDIRILELFLLGYQGLVADRYLHRLSGFVSDILTNFTPAVELLLQLSSGKSSAESEAILSILANQLGIHFATWGRQVIDFSGGRTVIHHSNDTTSLHKRFYQIFPRLYDDHGMLALDPNRQEYMICQQTFKSHSHLLHDAILVKQYPLAAFLMDLDSGNLLQVQTSAGNMLMHHLVLTSCKIACIGCVTMVQRLTKQSGGKFTNIPNKEGKLPAHLAIERNVPPALLEVVLDCTDDLNYKDEEGNSPLHYARSETALDILLQHKDIDLFSRNRKGQTFFAALCNHYNYKFEKAMSQSLLNSEKQLAWTADKSPQRFTPLHHAMGLTGGYLMDSAPAFLLKLPEVEQILEGFLAVGTEGSMRVRWYARDSNLKQALEVMDRIGFGLPPGH